jgi:uncharacterized membrane protein YoaK (UPF0700 family)
MADLLLYVLIALAILVPFVVLPEILERWGYEPRSRFVRLLVWSCFLLLLLVPAVLSGALWTVLGPADWLILFGAISFAMLWEYYRLHPGTFP